MTDEATPRVAHPSQLKLEATLTAAQYAAIWKDANSRLQRQAMDHSSVTTWLGTTVIATTVALIWQASLLRDLGRLASTQTIGLLVCIALAIVALFVYIRKYWQTAGAMFFAASAHARSAPIHLSFSEVGVRQTWRTGAHDFGWVEYGSVVEKDGLVLFQSLVGTQAVPLASFRNVSERQQLIAWANAQIAASKKLSGIASSDMHSQEAIPEAVFAASAGDSSQAHTGPGTESELESGLESELELPLALFPASPTATAWQSLRFWLSAGMRVLLFMPLSPAPEAKPMPALRHLVPWLGIALVVINLLLGLLVGIARLGWDGQAEWSMLQYGTTYVPVALLVAALLAVFRPGQADCSAGEVFGVLSLALLASAIPMTLLATWLQSPSVYQALLHRSSAFDAIWYFVPLWWSAAAVKLATRVLKFSSGAALVALMLCAIVFIVMQPFATVALGLWQPRYDPDLAAARNGPRPANPASEAVLYSQETLLRNALAKIQSDPTTPGKPQLYFVGMGGDATQEVFLKEVRSIEGWMKANFATDGRTVMLLNSPKTITDVPLANGTTLAATLQRIGEVMNREQDVLFLYMTSHGSKDHKFSLNFPPLQFNDMTPKTVRAALDAAKIKWRVVVVSACYAGGFVNDLKDEHTVVIAAAAPDKASFGCTNEADWTYFGKAFFDEALPQYLLLDKAFAAAREIVTARELKEKREPSAPQMAASPAMLAHWERLIDAQRGGQVKP